MAWRRELPLDGDDVEPRRLACDEPIAEFEDAKDPEPDRPAVPLHVERTSVRVAVDERLIDHEVIPLQPADRQDLGVLEVGKRFPVERPDRKLATQRIRIAPDGVMFDVLGIGGEDALDVALLLRCEVAFQQTIHLVLRHPARCYKPAA